MGRQLGIDLGIDESLIVLPLYVRRSSFRREHTAETRDAHDYKSFGSQPEQFHRMSGGADFGP